MRIANRAGAAALAAMTLVACGAMHRRPEPLPKGPPLRLPPNLAAELTPAASVSRLGCIVDPTASAPFVWGSGNVAWTPVESWSADSAMSVDLDHDGQPETIWVDERSYPARLRIVDGHDPLMIDQPVPIADARDLRVLGTADLDLNGKREVVVAFWNGAGWEVAAVAYESDQPAVEVACAPYSSP